MKKSIRIVLLIIVYLFFSINIAYAGDILNTGKEWINIGKNEQGNTNIDRSSFNDFAGILWSIGIFLIAICGVILGIKYMFSSVEEKASIKQTIWPFIIGAVIIMGALGIWRILIEFSEEII